MAPCWRPSAARRRQHVASPPSSHMFAILVAASPPGRQCSFSCNTACLPTAPKQTSCELRCGAACQQTCCNWWRGDELVSRLRSVRVCNHTSTVRKAVVRESVISGWTPSHSSQCASRKKCCPPPLPRSAQASHVAHRTPQFHLATSNDPRVSYMYESFVSTVLQGLRGAPHPYQVNEPLYLKGGPDLLALGVLAKSDIVLWIGHANWPDEQTWRHMRSMGVYTIYFNVDPARHCVVSRAEVPVPRPCRCTLSRSGVSSSFTCCCAG